MAQQHFYSRVPAKVSMFNRADGFDTFACSGELTDEQINNTLSCVFNNKPNKDEIAQIRDGKIPPVYFHYADKNGGWVQSCMSFLPLDYTGERTSYLVHSLLMDESETRAVLHSPDAEILNPELFVKTLDGFDITSFESTSDDEYPTLAYIAKKSAGTAAFLKTYDQDMIKRLIFALLSIACGNGKSVYLAVSDNLDTVSLDTLAFLNTVMQIFPYHIRVNLPFVTYTPDAVKYSAFRVKGVLESAPEIPSAKGITFHFRSKIVLGLQDDAVRAESFLVNFFFDLLSNDALRREFLSYVDSVNDKMPDGGKTTLKSMRELVLLFCQCSGLYNEKEIIPDDNAVHEFLSIYEKYRETLTDEFRANAMVILRRYPPAHKEIPSKTFTKIVKLYGAEPDYSKKTVMAVMLDLIHTDVTRSKIFAFLKSAYPTESEETKRQIVADLCRVYYGGFLRPQILEFFDEVFTKEPEESQNEMFEKILVNIRTDAIKDPVLAFIEKYYPIFTDGQKRKLYITFAEQLPYADELSRDFAAIIDRLVAADTEENRALLEEGLLKVIEKEQKRQEQPSLAMLVSGKYPYLFGALARKVFGDWAGRVILGRFIAQIFAGTLTNAMPTVVSVFRAVPEMPEDAVAALTEETLKQFEARGKRVPLVELVRMDADVDENVRCRAYADSVLNTVLRPMIAANIGEMYKVDGGLEACDVYAAKHAEICETEGYACIRTYRAMADAVEAAKISEFFRLCAGVPDNAVLGDLLRVLHSRTPEVSSADAIAPHLALCLAPVLAGTALNVNATFDPLVKQLTKYAAVPQPEKEPGFGAFTSAIILYVETLDELCRVASGDRLTELMNRLMPASQILSTLKTRFKKSGEKWIHDQQDELFARIDGELSGIFFAEIKSAGSWISRLFRK